METQTKLHIPTLFALTVTAQIALPEGWTVKETDASVVLYDPEGRAHYPTVKYMQGLFGPIPNVPPFDSVTGCMSIEKVLEAP